MLQYNIAGTMPNFKIESVNLEFLVKLKKSPTEYFKLLTEVYGKVTMSRTRAFEWHKWLSERREKIDDDEHSGRPNKSNTDENIENINEIVRNERQLSIRMIANMVHIDKETFRQILHDQLNMKKVCVKMVPKNLTQDQKDNRKVIFSEILQRLNEQLNLLENVITCDET